ncbi:MAG: hypothetical protein KDD02_24800 [Phaeodactylibacter sp.]|nr:hypothetical protein [Phaeodactylibacter sp.]
MKIAKIIPLFTLLNFLFFASPVKAQGWQHIYPDTASAYSITRQALPTPDGGYIAVGDYSLPTGAIRNYIRLLKVDAGGVKQWEQIYHEGDIRSDQSCGVALADDGGYFILGSSDAIDYNAAGQMWLLRLDASGDTLWTREYSANTLWTTATALTPTGDGGLLLTASTFNSSDTTAGAYLLKVGLDGNPLWEKHYQWHTSYNYFTLENVTLLSDGGFVAAGAWANPATPAVVRFDAQGDTLWAKTYAFSTGDELWDVEPTADGGFLTCGGATGFAGVNPIVLKLDAEGNQQWQNIYDINYGKAVSMTKAPDGGYVLAGSLDHYLWYPTAPYGFLLKINEDGAEQWRRELEQAWGGYSRLASVEPTPDGGYIAAGETGWKAFLMKTDGLGNSITNVLNGSVFSDANFSCAYEAGEDSLSGWKLQIEGDGPLQYATTDTDGNFSITLDTGVYIITVLPPNNLWEACVASYAVHFENFYDTITVDFAMQPAIECPVMQVDVSTPLLRRCFENQYSVHYCNEGAIAGEAAAVEIELDPYLSLANSELPYQALGNNRFRFELGDVPINTCGDFHFTAYLSCDGTVLGQTHCVEAHIFPDTVCIEPAISTPVVELDAGCSGDSVYFTLRNVGIVNMVMPADYIVIEDDVMYLPRTFNLDAGDSIRITEPANGSTYRLEVPQQPNVGDTELVSATVEGCGTNDMGSFSIGYVNQFPLYTGDAFLDIECRESIGSYDPNDKQALPRGYDELHYLKAGTDIEYLIRFQNTGTDTAFTVVIRDTLSPLLDPASVKPGASSHDYDWALSGEGILTFTFNHIMLPDSNVNEAASHGFVKFGISQRPGNQLGSVINNRAGIYFDFNAPVLTNTVFHTLGEDFVQVVNTEEPAQAARLSVTVAPNPVSQWAAFSVEGMEFTEGDFLLYHSNGALALRQSFQNSQFGLDVSQLPGGMYFFRLVVDGRPVGSGKLVVGKL